MNGSTDRQSTSVSIDGTRTVLAFGTRYRVRYGRDSKILEDALLIERVANGDLVFDAGTGTLVAKVRVRPSAIDAIFGSGVDHTDGPIIPDRFPAETLSSYLARIESELGDDYSRSIGTDAGQALLAAVAAEDRAGRKTVLRAGIFGGRTSAIGPKPIGAIFAAPKPVAHPDLVTEPITRLATKAERDAGSPSVVPFRSTSTKTTAKGRAKLAAVGVEDPPETLPAGPTVIVPAKGRPYAERNQVWKCGTCKRRTRVPVCTGPGGATHEPVSAPAGKRRDDR